MAQRTPDDTDRKRQVPVVATPSSANGESYASTSTYHEREGPIASAAWLQARHTRVHPPAAPSCIVTRCTPAPRSADTESEPSSPFSKYRPPSAVSARRGAKYPAAEPRWK